MDWDAEWARYQARYQRDQAVADAAHDRHEARMKVAREENPAATDEELMSALYEDEDDQRDRCGCSDAACPCSGAKRQGWPVRL
tara:strand:- start:280 stop:531 length:252 start_codon:yes stop_codon:yes gene_type:complete